MKAKAQSVMDKALEDPKNRGKHIIVVGDKVYSATPRGISKLWDRVRKKHPDEQLEYGYLGPKGFLIV